MSWKKKRKEKKRRDGRRERERPEGRESQPQDWGEELKVSVNELSTYDEWMNG